MTAVAVEAPYNGYQYDFYDTAVPAPNAYLPSRTLTGVAIDNDGFSGANDMFISGESLFILDSQRGRIISTTVEYRDFKIINAVDKNGENILKGATGLYVRFDKIYIAQPELSRIYILDMSGRILNEIGAPQSDLFDKSIPFRPSKVLIDSQEILYVISKGCTKGALTFNSQHKFLGYFGSGRVPITFTVLTDYFWKALMNDTQLAGMRQNVPIEFENFDVDKGDFIFTVTANIETKINQLQKFNPESTNILDDRNFADVETARVFSTVTSTQFSDVRALDNGMFVGIDRASGKSYLYNRDGETICAFGGLGTAFGLSMNPLAVDSHGNDIYVLDAGSNKITVYSLSEYGGYLLNAIQLYNAGDYTNSLEVWQKVLELNAGLRFAHKGTGKAYLAMNEPALAMKSFKLAGDRESYSLAFAPYRKVIIRNNIYILLGVLLIAIAFLLWPRKKKLTKRKQIYNINSLKLPKKTMLAIFHPSETLTPLTKETVKVWRVPAVILGAWFVLATLSWQFTGFIFNTNDIQRFDVFQILFSTIIIFVLFCLSNWLFATMLNGNGRFMDILVVCAVALVPYIVSVAINFILSNFLLADESGLMGIITVVAVIWSALILIIGMMSQHEFSFFASIGVILLTLFGIAVIAFLALLLWSLTQQIYGFVSGVWDELILVTTNG